MHTKVLLCLLLYSILNGPTVQAQLSISGIVRNVLPADTVKMPVKMNKAFDQPHFNYKNLLLPSAMIVYGITGLKSHGVQAVNEKVEEEIWTDHVHKQIHLDNYLQWAPSAAVYGLNIAGVKGKHNFRDRSIIYMISNVVMGSVVYAGKKISKEERPDGSNNASFPSGHTATAFAAAEFMRREYNDVSPWYSVGGYAAAIATGYLRLYNNKHWVSDVVAGAGLGILSTDLAYYIYPSVKKIFSGKQNSSTIILPTYRSGTVGVGAVHVF